MNVAEELKWLIESEASALRTFAHDGGAELVALDRACGLLLQALRSAPTQTGRDEIDIDAADLDSDQPAELALKAHVLLAEARYFPDTVQRFLLRLRSAGRTVNSVCAIAD